MEQPHTLKQLHPQATMLLHGKHSPLVKIHTKPIKPISHTKTSPIHKKQHKRDKTQMVRGTQYCIRKHQKSHRNGHRKQTL